MLLVSCSIAVVGCKKKTAVPVESLSVETTPRSENHVPVHKAEIRVAMRGASGESFITAWLTYSRRIEETLQKTGDVSASIKNWETESGSISFTMEDGRYCSISPIFLEHDAGLDVWEFQLNYRSAEESSEDHTTEKSVTASFGGHTQVLVFEDEHHTIRIRPRTPITEL